MNKFKTIVTMPAYNAELTLSRTIEDIPFEFVDELLLVDDASRDNTMEEAKKIASTSPKLVLGGEEAISGRKPFFIHKIAENVGYGGNQKACYDIALDRGSDIIIMIHPDYQYDPKVIPEIIELLKGGSCDVVLGNRIRSMKESLSGGMPLYKYLGNKFLTFIENKASGQNLSEWHTGLRAYKREVLEEIDYKSFADGFIFDTQMLFAIVGKGFKIGEVDVPVRYFEEASSINLRRSIKYGLWTLLETVKFLLHKK